MHCYIATMINTTEMHVEDFWSFDDEMSDQSVKMWRSRNYSKRTTADDKDIVLFQLSHHRKTLEFSERRQATITRWREEFWQQKKCKEKRKWRAVFPKPSQRFCYGSVTYTLPFRIPLAWNSLLCSWIITERDLPVDGASSAVKFLRPYENDVRKCLSIDIHFALSFWIHFRIPQPA